MSVIVIGSVGRNQIISEYRRTRDWLCVLLQTTAFPLRRVSAIECIMLLHGKSTAFFVFKVWSSSNHLLLLFLLVGTIMVEGKRQWTEKLQWKSFLMWYEPLSINCNLKMWIYSFNDRPEKCIYGGFITPLLQIKSTKPDKFTPRIVEKKDDYVHVEYESPILGVRKQAFCCPLSITVTRDFWEKPFSLLWFLSLTSWWMMLNSCLLPGKTRQWSIDLHPGKGTSTLMSTGSE